MKQIDIQDLEAQSCYWARRKPIKGAPFEEPHDIEIIQISTVFGSATEFWTVAVMGSDQHFGLEEYEFLHKVPSPTAATQKRVSMRLVRPFNRSVGF